MATETSRTATATEITPMLIDQLPRESYLRGPSWASAEARALWTPRLARAQALWRRLEVESVGELRNCALLVLPRPEDLIELCGWAAATGRQVTVLGSGRVAVHVHDAALSRVWVNCWQAGDDEQMGMLLGFPECCRRAFSRTWGRGMRDLTWAQFLAGGTCDGGLGCNMLHRWLGLRLVPHLPCTFTCERTEATAEQFIGLAKKLSAHEDLWHLTSALSQRVVYSSLHGTAQVATDAYRFEFDSDYASQELRLERAALPVDEEFVAPEPLEHEDNGFSCREAMESAHTIILAAARPLSGCGVLDLGCGGGTLMSRMAARLGVRPMGVDADVGRITRGQARNPEVLLVRMSIQECPSQWEQPTDAALLMPGRLLEMDPSSAREVRAWMRSSFKMVLLYSYEGGLEDLCRRADLPVPVNIVRQHRGKVEAGVVGW